MRTGNAKVDAIAQMNIVGNVVPHTWYHKLKRESGKPYMTAIVILADILYWYRPIEVIDPNTNMVIGYKKKFSSDLLMRTYSQLADMFGISKREATMAIIYLEKHGLVKRVFREIKTDYAVLSNVLYLDINPEKIKELTYGADEESENEETPENQEMIGQTQNDTDPSIHERVTPPVQECEYTENTTENLTESINIGCGESACASLTSCSNIFRVYEEEIGILSPTVSEALKDLINEFGAELVEYAIKESAKSNARSVRYIDGILNNLRQRNITTVSEAKSESNKVRKEKKMTDYEKETAEYEKLFKKNDNGVMFF